MLLTHDLHGIYYSEDGHYYTTGNTWYESWKKYLISFENIMVMLRVRRESHIPQDVRPLDGDRVTIVGLREFGGSSVSPLSFMQNLVKIRRSVVNADILIIRAGLVGNLAYLLMPRNKPFALEVVGDPYDVFSKWAFQHPLRPIIRVIYVALLKRQCKSSAAISYVTETTLQKRYPPNPSAYIISCSNVELNADDYVVEAPKLSFCSRTKTTKIICVGNFYQRYKGQDDLIKAVALSKRKGFKIKLVLVGSGKHLGYLEALAQQEGIADDIEFPGALTSCEIRKRLDDSDIFVLASRTEGLPRALIEAMARGKPCISTKVGGIPELLPDSCLVAANHPDLLAEKIHEMINNSEYSNEMAKRNLEKAKQYRSELLSIRRDQLYSAIRRLAVDKKQQCNTSSS